MILARPDPTPVRDPAGRPLRDICVENIKALANKANHNKLESHLCFWTTIVPTLLAPVFLLASDTFLVGKLVPALLSVIAAASTAWLQLRKPQQLWAIYKTGQRKLENELLRYDYKSVEYSGQDRDEKFLAAQLQISSEVHDRWLAIVPSIEDLKPISTFAANIK